MYISESEKHTLLIIEDNIDLVSFLKAKLSNEYVVYTSDGSDAIEKAMEIVPDIIICDINLVDKDGYEISKELKKGFTFITYSNYYFNGPKQ